MNREKDTGVAATREAGELEILRLCRSLGSSPFTQMALIAAHRKAKEMALERGK